MLRQPGFVLATGYILYFFSERLFWTIYREGDTITDYVITWLAYCVVTYLFLSLMSVFRVTHWPAVFIAGAIYGWLVEGGLAGTLYGTEDSAPFPVSLLCTGVSWHAMITVLIGWYLARQILSRNRGWETLALAAGIGLFWGCWAPFQWLETPPVITPIPTFLFTASIMSILLILSYWLAERSGCIEFRPTKFGVGFCVLIITVFYYQHVVNLGQRPLIILPVLLLAGCGLLYRYRIMKPELKSDTAPFASCRLTNYLILMAIPLVATGVYSIALWAGPHWPQLHKSIYPVTIFIGGIILAFSIFWILSMKPQKAIDYNNTDSC